MLMARRPARIWCPKCRALGLSTDCTDSLTHARRKNEMTYDDDDELIVTLTFSVPAPGSGGFLRDKATQLRDEWSEEPGALLDVIADLGDDYELTVKPFSEP